MKLDPAVIFDYWHFYLEGALLTLQITVIAFFAGLALAMAITPLSFLPLAPLRAAVAVYLAVLRGIPFIVIVFLVHYGMPFAGIRLPALATGTIALSLFASAYYSEVMRGTVLALPRGQWDSARAIGMTPVEAVRHVILPQILKPSVPPMTNYTISMIKESSILSVITVGELTYQGLVVQGRTFAPFEVFFAVGGLYWFMTWVVTQAAASLEWRLGAGERQAKVHNALAERYLSLEIRRSQ